MRARLRALLVLAATACSNAGEPSEVAGLRFVAVSAGMGHSCGRTTAGTTYCWGDNISGQIGAETGEQENPVPLHIVVRPLELTSISAGTSISCGLLNTGVPLCWGNGEAGPRQLSGGARFRSISAGEFICGAREDGAAVCWDHPDAEPRQVVGPGFTQVQVGGLACGLANDGVAWCWAADGSSAQPVPGGFVFSDLTVGGTHACGIIPDGAAYCWGQNTFGQLGNLSTTSSSTPDTVAGFRSWSQLSAGVAHTCGVTTTGGAFCWGAATNGRLGYNGPAPVGGTFNSPTRVRGPEVPESMTWRAVAAGGTHSCGVSAEGITFCWGENGSGQLGDGSTESTAAPVPIGPGE